MAQTGKGPVLIVAFPCFRGGFWSMENSALFQDKEENQSVGQTKELAKIVLPVQVPAGKFLAQGRVCLHEALSQCLNGSRHVAAQGIECRHGGILGIPAPPFQPALFRGHAVRMNTGLMGAQPEQGKLAERLFLENAFEIEFDIGLTGQTCVVTQDAQKQAVGDKAPQMFVRAVEKFLHKGVRALSGRSGDTGLFAVQGHIAAHKMNGRFVPEVGDGKADSCAVRKFYLTLLGSRLGEPAVAKLDKKRQKQTFTRLSCAGFRVGELLSDLAKGAPDSEHFLPGTVDDLVLPFTHKMVVLVSQAFHILVAVQDALQCVCGQKLSVGLNIGKARCVHSGHGVYLVLNDGKIDENAKDVGLPLCLHLVPHIAHL